MNGNIPAVGSGNRGRFARLAGLKRALIDMPVRRFRDLKMRKKLIWTYIIVVLIPIFMVGMILTNGMRNMAIEQAIKEACTNTDRIQLRLNELTNRVTEISDRIYFSARTREILSTDYKTRWGVVREYFDFSEFAEYRRDYAEIRYIMIYTSNNTLLDNWEFIPVGEDITEKPWYGKAVEKNGEIVWQYIRNELYDRDSLCLTRLIKNDLNQLLGVLIIEISDSFLQSIIAEEPYKTIIAVDSAHIVSSNHSELIGQKTWDEGIQFISETVNNQFRDLYRGKDSSKVITNSFVPKTSSSIFNIYTIVPVQSITKKAEEISTLGFSIMGLSFAISLVLLVFFSHVLSSRIIRLRSEMRKVVEGKYDISDKIQGMDEIGELHVDLLKMVRSFEQLIHEVYEERLLKEQLRNKQREIQFKMLANQINPHFLYNVLETIRMRSHSKGDAETAGAVKLLARLMRRNLEATSKTVTLESELEIMKNYLKLQKYRFEDKIDYEIEIAAEGYEEYRMLPMLLQPLVENAFVHGLECKRTRGRVTIRVEEQDGLLVISVRDNGVGMDRTRLERLRSMLNGNGEESGIHIGLQNVNSRIKLYYGEAYGLDIASAENEGTLVRIRLPRKEENRD